MATINYNGNEIESISECKVFDEPRNMLVWNRDFETPIEKFVCAIIPYRHEGRVITRGGFYEYCAEIPEKPAPRRATWMEIAKWCATGNGLVLDELIEKIDTGVIFKVDHSNNPVDDKIKIRKWDDTEFHEPTVEYMGITKE